MRTITRILETLRQGLIDSCELGLQHFGTESLLLGLLCNRGCVGNLLLEHVASLKEVREELSKSLAIVSDRRFRELPFTPRCKNILRSEIQTIVENCGETKVTTKHLLLAILENPEATANQVLRSLRVDLDILRLSARAAEAE